MVGTNGKVGPNPRLVSKEYTFKSDGLMIQSEVFLGVYINIP
jgi:hypothetical protein